MNMAGAERFGNAPGSGDESAELPETPAIEAAPPDSKTLVPVRVKKRAKLLTKVTDLVLPQTGPDRAADRSRPR